MEKLLLPYNADNSQIKAIEDSSTKSFILYGPPGCGKSQTITNIIINNIVKGKSVLFVCEKQSGLDVIKKQLDNINLFPFYLNVDKSTNKNKILRKIQDSLSITPKSYDKKLFFLDEKIKTSTDFLIDYYNKINSITDYGFSIYQAICEYFKIKDTDDFIVIDDYFIYKTPWQSIPHYLELIKTYISMNNDSKFSNIKLLNSIKNPTSNCLNILKIHLNASTSIFEYLKYILKRNDITQLDAEAFYSLTESLLLIDNKNINLELMQSCYNHENLKLKISILKNNFLIKYNYMPKYININKLNIAIKNNKYPLSIKKIIPKNIKKIDTLEYLTNLLSLYKLIDEYESIDKKLLKYNIEALSNIYKNIEILKIENPKSYLLDLLKDISTIEYYRKLFLAYSMSKKQFSTYFNYQENVKFLSLIKDLNNAINHYHHIDKINKLNNIKLSIESAGIYIKKHCSIKQALNSFYKSFYKQFIKYQIEQSNLLSSFSICEFERIKNELYMNLKLKQNKDCLDAYNLLYHNQVKYKSTTDFKNIKSLLFTLENEENINTKDVLYKIKNHIFNITPCIISNATTANDYFKNYKFDLIVFDEASQLTYSKSNTILKNGTIQIIVGDDKQLPPTTFFIDKLPLKDSYSLFEYAIKTFDNKNELLWHYRSKHESLISFSNTNFYKNKLLTIPSANYLTSAISFHYIDGIYDKGKSKTNIIEAQAIVDFVIKKLSDNKFNHTIGIIAFNISQQKCIESLLNLSLKKHNLYNKAYNTKTPLFVKNLENIQGDERDIIILSIGFSKDIQGKLSLNLGPINKEDGYKRLNVALTRAKFNMEIFSGILDDMIDLNKTSSLGIKYLKEFLYYAKNYSHVYKNTNLEFSIGKIISNMLAKYGVQSHYDIGLSSFKIDVAIIDPIQKNKYILAIISDGNNIYNIKSQMDRIIIEKELLKDNGWSIYNLSIISFYENPEEEIKKIRNKIYDISGKKFNKIKITKPKLDDVKII